MSVTWSDCPFCWKWTRPCLGTVSHSVHLISNSLLNGIPERAPTWMPSRPLQFIHFSPSIIGQEQIAKSGGNGRARGAKIVSLIRMTWKKFSWLESRPRSASDGLQHFTGNMKLDLERKFNEVMERERERRRLETGSSGSGVGSQRPSLNEGVPMPMEKNGEKHLRKERNKQQDDESAKQQKSSTLDNQVSNTKNIGMSMENDDTTKTLLLPQVPIIRLPESHLFKKLYVLFKSILNPPFQEC